MGILLLKNRCKGFGIGTSHSEVLRDISLDVAEGEFLAILGFSGTGKSTLMNLMAGFEMPDRGAALFKGQPISGPGAGVSKLQPDAVAHREGQRDAGGGCCSMSRSRRLMR